MEQKLTFMVAKPRSFLGDWSRIRQAWELLIGPCLAGAACGVLLGVRGWAYIAVVAVCALAGLPAGSQHRTWRGAVVRGLWCGALWAVTVLIAHGLSGWEPTVPTLEPAVFILSGAIPTSALAVLVWWVVIRRAMPS